jgi:thiamine-monophosphate kinase
VDEASLLKHIMSGWVGMAGAFRDVLVGPGDDCAVVRLGGERALLTIDQVVEGRHFRAGTDVGLIARKAVARSISDIAAMAGEPLFVVASGALPLGYDQGLARGLVDGLKRWSEHWGCALVGGDLASLPGADDAMVLNVMVIGRAHGVRGPVLRSGAKVGDGVYVTGVLGGSFEEGTGLGWHVEFEPRVREARELADGMGDRLRSMMDLSDGLGRDGGRLAAASGVRLELEAGWLPLRMGSGWMSGLGDGEDYELLFTASGDVPGDVCGTRVTRVGNVVEGTGCVVRGPGGEWIDAEEMGWNHGGKKS